MPPLIAHFLSHNCYSHWFISSRQVLLAIPLECAWFVVQNLQRIDVFLSIGMSIMEVALGFAFFHNPWLTIASACTNNSVSTKTTGTHFRQFSPMWFPMNRRASYWDPSDKRTMYRRAGFAHDPLHPQPPRVYFEPNRKFPFIRLYNAKRRRKLDIRCTKIQCNMQLDDTLVVHLECILSLARWLHASTHHRYQTIVLQHHFKLQSVAYPSLLFENSCMTAAPVTFFPLVTLRIGKISSTSSAALRGL